MLIVILSILAALSAVLTIVGKYRGSKRLEYIFKPLTMVWIILIAILADDPISTRYQVLILLGLLASIVGDVFLMLPDDRLLQGLVSFLIAHVFYIVAFTVESSGRAPIWYIIPFVLLGLFMLWLLWPYLERMRIPVVIYMSVILIMAWQAANRWIELRATDTLLAMIGAYLFVASDSVLAVQRFRGRFRSADFWVLALYFPAQWLIALSIGGQSIF
ncbi:MAG: lysoplasmalogenase [Chloroflexi bacterium]|nr:lysoplasmalogenase [Chloroflexota bacterium]